MLIPWMKGLLRWNLAPMTWTLVLLNFLAFLYTNPSVPGNTQTHSPSLNSEFSTVEMLVLTGHLYDQFRKTGQANSPVSIATAMKSQNDWLILGSQGLKNPEFIERAESFQFFGDDLAISDWKEKIISYRTEIAVRTSSRYGLKSGNTSPLTWVTYQFMHAGWVHLFGNMLMLLIFGAATESLSGGLVLAVVYVLSGMAGAWAFLLLGQDSLAPMIGASGSLSGVMAFYAAYEKKKRVSFFYFVSPIKGYFGWIYLPTLLIFPLCFLSDIAGYLSTPLEIGTGIAFAAHMGGALFGALLGFSLRPYRKNIYLQWIR